MYYLFITISVYVYRPTLHIRTPPLFQVELEKDGWEQLDMLWCHGAQNIGLTNYKLNSALKCTV